MLYAWQRGMDINWDMQNYHLYNGWAWLYHRMERDWAPAGLQTFFNPVLDVGYYLAFTYAPKSATLILAFVQGCCGVALYHLCKVVIRSAHGKEQPDILALTLASMSVLGTAFLSEAGTTFGDSLTALPLLISLLLIIQSRAAADAELPFSRMLFGAGLAAGVAAGLKLTNLIYVVPLGLCSLLVGTRWRQQLVTGGLFGIGMLLAFGVLGGYWMTTMWYEYKNPVFPQFNSIFPNEWIAADSSNRDTRFLPTTLLEHFLYPIIFSLHPQRVSELKYRQYVWLLAYVSVVAIFIRSAFIRHKTFTMPVKILLTFLLVSYVFWQTAFSIYRYIVVLELLLPVSILLCINHCWEQRRTQAWTVCILLLASVAGALKPPDWGRTQFTTPAFRVEWGSTDNPPTAVLLAGQPLAWLSPYMPFDAAYYQIQPNFKLSAHAIKSLSSKLEREPIMEVILPDREPETLATAQHFADDYGLIVQVDRCQDFAAFMGSHRFELRRCHVISAKNSLNPIPSRS